MYGISLEWRTRATGQSNNDDDNINIKNDDGKFVLYYFSGTYILFRYTRPVLYARKRDSTRTVAVY